MPFRRQIRRLRFWRRHPASSQPHHTDSHETTRGRLAGPDYLIPRPPNEGSQIGPAERYLGEVAQMDAIHEDSDQHGDTPTGGWGLEGITATTETETRVETLTDQSTGTTEDHATLTNEPSAETRGNDIAAANRVFYSISDAQADRNIRRNRYAALLNGLDEPEESGSNLERNGRQTEELAAQAREALRSYSLQPSNEQHVTPTNQPAAQFAPLADRVPPDQLATIQEHLQENPEADYQEQLAIHHHQNDIHRDLSWTHGRREAFLASNEAAYQQIREQSRRQGHIIAQLQSQINALRLRLDAQDHVINTVRALVTPLHDRTRPSGERVLGDHTILMRMNERMRLENQMRDWDHPGLLQRHQDNSINELITEHTSMRDNQGYVEVMLGRSMPADPPSSPPPPHETSPPPRAQAPPMPMDNVAIVVDMPGQNGARHAAQALNLVNLELTLRAVNEGGNQS